MTIIMLIMLIFNPRCRDIYYIENEGTRWARRTVNDFGIAKIMFITIDIVLYFIYIGVTDYIQLQNTSLPIPPADHSSIDSESFESVKQLFKRQK